MNKINILIIDDEPQIRRLLEITLENNGYNVLQASSAKEGVLQAATHAPDLILLDIGLPDKTGHEVLKELTIWYNKPIIMLSVQNSEADIVNALDNGATDYLTKPFRTAELLARIRSCLRKHSSTENNTIIVSETLQVDLVARVVKKKNDIIKLTATEYNLIALLASNQGKILTHQFILKEIWGVAYQLETQYLRVFIAQVRKKLEDNPNTPKHIITESRVGYRFV